MGSVTAVKGSSRYRVRKTPPTRGINSLPDKRTNCIQRTPPRKPTTETQETHKVDSVDGTGIILDILT